MKDLFVTKKNKRNSGFSLVELVVAIGILAVISTIVAFMMTSSSKNYSRMSVETQLQSEAQLVANAISEYAIDSYNAENLCAETIDSAYDNTENKILVLHSLARDGVEYDYVIARTAENKLYLGERSKPVGGTWSSYSFSLLGNYISDFTVDTSHVEKENIIDFQLSYTKNQRTYNGNYQVLMRNRAYADKDPENNPNNEPMKMVLGLQPKQVYVDIVAGAPGNYYYINEISDGSRRNFSSREIDFTASVTSNKMLDNNDVEWFLNGADANGFRMPEAEAGMDGNKTLSTTAKLQIIDGYNFDNSAIDDFTVSVAKAVTDSEGNTVSATSKQSKIHLRRVKSIRLIATSGSSPWKSAWDTYTGTAVKSDEVDGYAYPDAYGRYQTMVLNANVVQKWVPYAGGLTWKIEMREPDSTAWVTPSSNYARLQYNETNASTTNSVLFGSGVKNGQIYKVTVTSKFDSTKYAEYMFGVAPREREEGGGYNSRGFYVNMNEYFENTSFPGLNAANGDQDIFKKKAVGKVVLTSWGSSFENGAFKLEQGANGDWYFYIDYSAFQYSQQQRFNFYNQAGMIEFNVYDTENNWMATVYYNVLPVYVHKVAPATDVLILSRGKSTDVVVKSDYYNILSADYFGIYIDNDSTQGTDSRFSNNLNGTNFDTNAYLRVEYASSYGDVKHYIDTARVTLTAKDSLVYNANPMTLRLTAEDYYNLCSDSDRTAKEAGGDRRYGWTGMTSPCTDYTVYIANVVGQNVFISGPSTTVGTCAFPKDSVKKATSSSPVAISGYNANGQYVANIAQAYMQGSKYMCVYNGNTYTYNQTYHYWSN